MALPPNAPAAPPPPEVASDPRLQFEREKWQEERQLRERELAVKEADRPSPWRSPLIITIAAAAAAAAGNLIVSGTNASSQVRLERVKAEQNLIIEAIKTGGDVEKAAANLGFLVNTRLVTDQERAVAIRQYLTQNRNRPELLPSLPSVGQTQPPASRLRPPVGAPAVTTGPVPNSNPLRREARMAVLQLTATPSDGLRTYQLEVDGRNVQMGADQSARIEIAGACGDQSVHRLGYRLFGPAGSKLSIAIACGGRPISHTGEIEVSETGQPVAAGSQIFRL
jgi:hypothetical protein